MFGNCCGNGTGARSAQQGGPWSATKRPSATGNARRGPALKKSRQRRAHDRLHRRKRAESASPSVSHLGAAWANSRAAVPLQLEDYIHCSRDDGLELLLPDLRKGGWQARDDSLPDSPPPIHQNTVIWWSGTGCQHIAADWWVSSWIPWTAGSPSNTSRLMRRNSIQWSTCGVTGSTIRCPTYVPRICGNSARARAEPCADSGADRALLPLSGNSLLCRSTELYYANISSRL